MIKLIPIDFVNTTLGRKYKATIFYLTLVDDDTQKIPGFSLLDDFLGKV